MEAYSHNFVPHYPIFSVKRDNRYPGWRVGSNPEFVAPFSVHTTFALHPSYFSPLPTPRKTLKTGHRLPTLPSLAASPPLNSQPTSLAPRPAPEDATAIDFTYNPAPLFITLNMDVRFLKWGERRQGKKEYFWTMFLAGKRATLCCGFWGRWFWHLLSVRGRGHSPLFATPCHLLDGLYGWKSCPLGHRGRVLRKASGEVAVGCLPQYHLDHCFEKVRTTLTLEKCNLIWYRE